MKNRVDIQALRGIAVLSVVLFHFRLNLLEAGYLGVDIFFVISGYLITSMVTSQIELGKFSFKEFYFRRAKRLLPAAYSTFFLTSLLSMWLLTSHEFKQFTYQLWGAVSFSSNIVLWRQGSYFGGEADLKPLLHTWSLAIEEQYYLLLPAFLYFTPARHWYKGIFLVFLSSATLCFLVMTWRPDIAFYFLPTRGWELAIGSLGVFLIKNHQIQKLAKQLFWPALIILLTLPVQPISNKHPEIDAWLVCISTLIVILAKHQLFNQGRLIAVLARVGDLSYSLYLVHWPIMALASNVWIGEIPVWVKWGGLGLSFALSWIQFTFIENPIRNARIEPTMSRTIMIVCGSVALMIVPFMFLLSPYSRQDFTEIRRGNTGLSAICTFSEKFQPSDQCQTSVNPKILVWGDSYAMHLVPGIKNEIGTKGLVQATKYVCGPLLSVAPIAHFTGATQNRRWAEGCLSFNDSVLEYLKKTTSIETVVLSSVFIQYVTPENFHHLHRNETGFTEGPGTVEEALLGVERTVKALRALGKDVVIIAPPPALDWDAGRCAERLIRNKPIFGTDADCTIKSDEYKKKRANVLYLLGEIQNRFGVDVIAFDDYLRGDDQYKTIINDEIIYISNGHLSYRGSEILAKELKLGDLIESRAK